MVGGANRTGPYRGFCEGLTVLIRQSQLMWVNRTIFVKKNASRHTFLPRHHSFKNKPKNMPSCKLEVKLAEDDMEQKKTTKHVKYTKFVPNWLCCTHN